MQDHPIAALFPLIPEGELNELSDSIARSGQRDDIVLFEGKILDGRNRFRACTLAEVKPRTRVFDPKKDGPSPLAFVLDLNLSRRHLSTSQRAAIAAEALKMRESAAQKTIDFPTPAAATLPDAVANTEAMKEATEADDDLAADDKPPVTTPAEKPEEKAPTAKETAAKMGVSERSVSSATKLEKENPEKFQDVKDGKKTLNAATNEAATEKLKEQRKEAIARVVKVCGKEFGDALARNAILKTVKELTAFLALTDEQMKAVQPLVSTGWKVARALAHAMDSLTAESTITDLINKAIAGGGEEFVMVLNGWEISAIQVGASHNSDGTKATK